MNNEQPFQAAMPTVPAEDPKPPRKKRGFLRRSWPIALTAVISLGVGAAIAGGAPETIEVQRDVPGPEVTVTAKPEPAPTVTVTAKPEVVTETETITEEVTIEVVDPLCASVALEAWDILEDQVNNVTIPYTEIVQTLVEQLQYGADAATIDAAAVKLRNITDAANEQTDRVSAVKPDYLICASQVE